MPSVSKTLFQETIAKLMKILIVDDDERIRQMIKTILAGDEVVICECSNGAEAYACYAEHQPDWVLMDITLPGVDGLAATRSIKANYPEARILIVTSHESHAMREAAREAGARGYVLKENLLDLREMVQKNAAPAA
jgi:DNA-binding NarL/FixJ family response regulator